MRVGGGGGDGLLETSDLGCWPLSHSPTTRSTGFSAVVTFGRTVQDDGTGGLQPWGTVIAYNKVRID